MKISQEELMNEGFWSKFKVPFKVLGGLAGAAVKGTAKALDYVAPEITQPLHSFEAGVRDVGDATRRGFDVGYGGLKKEYSDILLDAGYVADPDIKVIDSGKNKVVVGYRIIDRDPKGNPVPDKSKRITFLFDRQNNVKIVKTSAQDTTPMVNTKPTKFKTVKQNKPKQVKRPTEFKYK